MSKVAMVIGLDDTFLKQDVVDDLELEIQSLREVRIAGIDVTITVREGPPEITLGDYCLITEDIEDTAWKAVSKTILSKQGRDHFVAGGKYLELVIQAEEEIEVERDYLEPLKSFAR